MTALIWAMLVARRGVTLTIVLIAAVSVAAGSAGPIYLAAAGAAARAVELEAAPPGDRAISQTWAVDHSETPVGARLNERRAAIQFRDFDSITGFQISGAVTGPAERELWLVQRSGVCEQVVAVAGRCVSGAWEVMISRRAADELGVRVGHTIGFRPQVVDEYGSEEPVADAARLSVVGVYTPRDPTSAYWANREYVTGDDRAAGREVLFATAETIAWLPYADGQEIVDLVPDEKVFADPDRLNAIVANTAGTGELGDVATETGIPQLLQRIDASHRTLAEGVGVAVLPLVLLCWLVLYLAVTSSAFRRRAETGLSRLRGVPAWTRWWLGVAEYLVPIVVGAPLGLLGGYLGVRALTGWLLPDDVAVTVTPLALAFAGAAVVGAVAVGMVAQWRATAVSVATLLRRVPARRTGGRVGAGELVAITLAGAATYQVVTGGAQAGGLALLAPMFLALAIGVVVARLVALAAVGLARRGLRRGALGRALAAVVVARQPGQARLLGMFIVLFALLGFAVTAADVAAHARAARATAELGAARVLDVRAVPAGQLLSAVRAADPSGRHAMAVTRLAGDGPPVLAVDSARLAGVSAWSGTYGLTAQRAAELLRPAPAEPIRFTGSGIELRMTVTGGQPAGARVVALLQPDLGAPIEPVVAVRPGVRTYRLATPACRDGCRLLGLALQAGGQARYDVAVTVHSLRQLGPAAPAVDAAHLGDARRWSLSGGGAGTAATTVAHGATGARLAYDGNIGPLSTLRPVGTPSPVPLLTSMGLRPALAVSGEATPARRAGELRLVPGAGAAGILVDLEYAELAGYLSGLARTPQVWLSADAPADLADRLSDAGLAVVADRSLAVERQRQEQRGPALALRFYLVVAIAAVALGLGGVAVVASSERGGLAAQLRALRVQGVPAGITWRVGFGGHAALTVLAAVVGSAAAALAWWVARGTIPLFTDGGEQFYAPAWPRPAIVVVALLAAMLVLTAAGAVATLGLRRAVERGNG
jgi:hypothetical protein